MADEIIGAAAQAVAAEGGAVVLVPDAAAERAEQATPPEPPAVVVVEAPPAEGGSDALLALTELVKTFHGDMVGLMERLGQAEGRLNALELTQIATPAEPAPMAEETVVAPTDEIAPPPSEPTSAPKKHAGFWV